MNRVLLLATTLLLAGCGNQQKLKPPQGATLPPRPAMSPATPTVTELLAPVPTIKPTRSDELLTRSQPRAEDPFDLPPK